MQLQDAARSILSQLSDLLGKLDGQKYTATLEVLNGNSIGKHVRHILEFFIVLEDGATSGLINYDMRPHDELYERDLLASLESISAIYEFLKDLSLDKSSILEVSYSLDGLESVQIPSSLHRELAYNIEHAIHHMAIIKIAVKGAFPQITIAENFGVAYSTIRHQRVHAG